MLYKIVENLLDS